MVATVTLPNQHCLGFQDQWLKAYYFSVYHHDETQLHISLGTPAAALKQQEISQHGAPAQLQQEGWHSATADDAGHGVTHAASLSAIPHQQ